MMDDGFHHCCRAGGWAQGRPHRAHSKPILGLQLVPLRAAPWNGRGAHAAYMVPPHDPPKKHVMQKDAHPDGGPARARNHTKPLSPKAPSSRHNTNACAAASKRLDVAARAAATPVVFGHSYVVPGRHAGGGRERTGAESGLESRGLRGREGEGAPDARPRAAGRPSHRLLAQRQGSPPCVPTLCADALDKLQQSKGDGESELQGANLDPGQQPTLHTCWPRGCCQPATTNYRPTNNQQPTNSQSTNDRPTTNDNNNIACSLATQEHQTRFTNFVASVQKVEELQAQNPRAQVSQVAGKGERLGVGEVAGKGIECHRMGQVEGEGGR
eukprot:363337-Chlamydomonas_euryale.AAC.5